MKTFQLTTEVDKSAQSTKEHTAQSRKTAGSSPHTCQQSPVYHFSLHYVRLVIFPPGPHRSCAASLACVHMLILMTLFCENGELVITEQKCDYRIPFARMIWNRLWLWHCVFWGSLNNPPLSLVGYKYALLPHPSWSAQTGTQSDFAAFTAPLFGSRSSWSAALFNWMFSLIRLLRHRLVWFCVTLICHLSFTPLSRSCFLSVWLFL